MVAEGVETAQQLDQLRELGCDQFQGFYRSAAVLPGEIAEFIAAAAEAAPVNPQRFIETQSKLTTFRRRKRCLWRRAGLRRSGGGGGVWAGKAVQLIGLQNVCHFIRWKRPV